MKIPRAYAARESFALPFINTFMAVHKILLLGVRADGPWKFLLDDNPCLMDSNSNTGLKSPVDLKIVFLFF